MPTVRANGITLAYESQGEGPPLLLIAGLGCGGSFFRPFVAELAHCLRLITFDNRGAGGSEKPPGPYSVKEMAADTASLLDALGLESVSVVGHSLGGMIAQELALAFPARVHRLVLACTIGGPNSIPITPEALSLMTNRKGDPFQIFRRSLEVTTAPGFTERHPERAAQLLQSRMTTLLTAESYQAQFQAGSRHDAEERLGSIACPTLVLTGEDDRVVPPGNADLLARRIRNSQLVRLPGVGHMPFAEAPEEVAGVVLRFLTDGAPPPPATPAG